MNAESQPSKIAIMPRRSRGTGKSLASEAAMRETAMIFTHNSQKNKVNRPLRQLTASGQGSRFAVKSYTTFALRAFTDGFFKITHCCKPFSVVHNVSP